jgi:hypothetical protein
MRSMDRPSEAAHPHFAVSLSLRWNSDEAVDTDPITRSSAPPHEHELTSGVDAELAVDLLEMEVDRLHR